MSTSRRPPAIGTTTAATRRRVASTTSLPQSRSTSARRDLGASTTSSVLSSTNKGDGSNIQVVVRCRGVSPTEVKNQSKVVATVPSSRGTTVTLTDPSPSFPSSASSSSSLAPSSSASLSTTSSSNPSNTRSWDFGSRQLAGGASANETKGNVYGPDAKQAMLYDEVAKPILEQVLEGYNCTIFAYGQTGTGKTYTMEGDLSPNGATFHDEAGIIPRTLYYLFDHLSKMNNAQEYTVRCSYVELYNEELRDLNARDDADATGGLKIYDETPHSMASKVGGPSSSNHARESSTTGSASSATSGGGGSVRIEGLEETFITDAEEGLEVLRRGSMRRISASTNMNERSSRSHSIFTILVHLKESPTSPTATAAASSSSASLMRVGKLNLVDLAGSENVGRSGAVQGRAREAGRINVSLLALGRVINMLSTNNNNNEATKLGHIPYRESKLTRLLQDSLGGNTKTTIIATISPTSYEETASTLSYALQATSIQNRPEMCRKIGRDVVVGQVMQELQRVKMDLKAARSGQGYYVSQETYEELELERQSYKASTLEHSSTLASLEIHKSELQSTRDQLEQNVRALSKTKESLKKTGDLLEDCQTQLEIVEKEREELKVENERLKCLTEAWEVSRRGWKEEAIDALGDVQGLRDKLARKTLVEESNLSVLNDAASSIASRTSEINDQTTKLRRAQAGFVESMQARLGEFSDRQRTTFEENRDIIDEFIGELAHNVRRVAIGDHTARRHAQAFREAVEATGRDISNKLRRRETEVAQEQDALTREFRDELKRHETETSTFFDALVRPVQGLRTECVARLGDDRTLLSMMSREEAENLASENTRLRDLVVTLEAALQEEETVQASEEAAIYARIQAELSSAARRRQNASRNTYELVRRGMEDTFESREEGSRKRRAHFERLEASSDEVRRCVESVVDQSEDVREEGRKAFASTIGVLQRIGTHQATVSSQTRQEQNSLLQNAASFVRESSTAHRTADSRSRYESRRALRSLIDQTGDVLAAWTLSSAATHEDVQSTVNDTLRTVDNFANTSARAISHVNLCNDVLASELQADLRRRVLHDVPTGSTPMPKERPPIDRLLPLVDLDSADRQSVLETLLQARDADIAASLAADEKNQLDLMGPMAEEAGAGNLSRSPSLEVVALPVVGGPPRPRASSVVVAHGKGELRRSRVGGVLGERDSNVVAGSGPQSRKPLGKRALAKKSVV